MTKTVHAVRRGQRLELLEPIDLSEGLQAAIAGELPGAMPEARPPLPVRSLGPMKGSLSREEIYGDNV